MLNRWRVTCWRIIRSLNTHIYTHTRTHSCTHGLLHWASHKHSISTILAAPPVRKSVAFSLFSDVNKENRDVLSFLHSHPPCTEGKPQDWRCFCEIYVRNTASFPYLPTRKGIGNRIVCQSISWRNIVPLNARIVTLEEGFRDGRCPGAEVNEVSRPPLCGWKWYSPPAQ